MKLAGRLARPHLWIAATSAVMVLTLALVGSGRTSPGPLASVHQRLPEFSDGGGCSDCHGGWRRDMNQACLDCHEGVARDLRERAGLHGVLGVEGAGRCATCHSDHHGGTFAMVNLQSFVNAGIADPSRFDHWRVGFQMGGKHLELGCTECHEHAEALVLPEGALRYRGLDQSCGGCHEDNHDGQMVLSCVKCHGQSAFDAQGLEAFEHEFFVPLTGGHQELACDVCHEPGTLHELDAIGRNGRPRNPRECASCHESPHVPGFLTGVAALAGKSEEASCGVCHRSEHTSFRQDVDVGTAQHAFSGFRLDPPHAETQCAECHDPGLASFAERYPGRGQDDCASCHDDPHGGQFGEGPFAALGCVGCHERTRFEPHAFGLEQHERTALALTGRHREADCDQCHAVLAEGEPRRFRGTPVECAGCHEDAHRGFFEERAALVAELSSPGCGTCHGTESFGPGQPSPDAPGTAADGGFDHGFWTGFAVDGAHAQARCDVCHPRAHEPDEHGRSFGRVEEHFGAFEGCVSCHADPHQGAFDGPAFPQQVEGRRDCARCHETSSFRAFPDGFAHGRWTGFELVGAHQAVGCAGCHEPLRRPDEAGRTWGRARGEQCADCHSDPHDGQFERAGTTSCVRCHKGGKTFSELSFHHNWHSRFLLDEAHEKLACSACHEAYTADGGRSVVRYRPLGRQCVDCHGVNEDQMLERSAKRRKR